MKTYTVEEIRQVLEAHRKWLYGVGGGVRANLSGTNLSGADLYGADLYGTDLSGADLSGANLSGANLSRANLSGTNLSGADLSGTNLSGADLYGANLSGANLSGTNLSGADLYGANLYGAKYGDYELRGFLQIGPIGSRKFIMQVFAVGPKDLIFRTGCFTGSAKELTAKVKDTHGDNKHGKDYLAAIRFAKAMLPPKGKS